MNESEQLVDNKIIILVGILMIVATVYIMYNIPADFDSQVYEMFDVALPEIEIPIGVDDFMPEPRVIDIPLDEVIEQIPQFKTFEEEVSWYAQFPDNPNFMPVIEDNRCDPLISQYKSNNTFEFKVIIAKLILEVCNF